MKKSLHFLITIILILANLGFILYHSLSPFAFQPNHREKIPFKYDTPEYVAKVKDYNENVEKFNNQVAEYASLPEVKHPFIALFGNLIGALVGIGVMTTIISRRLSKRPNHFQIALNTSLAIYLIAYYFSNPILYLFLMLLFLGIIISGWFGSKSRSANGEKNKQDEKDKGYTRKREIKGYFISVWSSLKKYKIVFLFVIILLGWFYWFQLRPIKIKHDCSWIKEHADPWAERTQAQYDECINKCNNKLTEIEISKNNIFLSPLPCSCEKPHPVRPAIDWWEKAGKTYYDFCIHEKGL